MDITIHLYRIEIHPSGMNLMILLLGILILRICLMRRLEGSRVGMIRNRGSKMRICFYTNGKRKRILM